jgi:hypothetical protein
MAANSFIEYVEKYKSDFKQEKKINVANFFKKYFAEKTPIKMKITYNENFQCSIKKARDCIIANLNLNPFFEKITYSLDDITSISSLLLDSKEYANENQQAQILFLLHLSKSNLGFIIEFFREIKTIQLISTGIEYKDEYDTLFENLINNKYVKKIISKVVKDISGKEIMFDFNFCKVEYFDTSIQGLNGFAGLDKIYISNMEQKNLSGLYKNYSQWKKIVIQKCNFARLVLHEMTHVILRRAINDFNLSSPKIFEANTDAILPVSYDGSIEAGVMAEKVLFKDKIDWQKSAESPNLNVEYCSSFLSSLLNEQEVIFDLKLSGVVVNDSKFAIMAVDFNFKD